MLRLADLAQRPDFQLGDLRISPARRRVDGPGGSRHVEPQFMLVFLRLLDAAGTVVTRAELFDECWGGAVVGDDSLNRAIAGVRQVGSAVGSAAFVIETIPRTGYVLRLAPSVEQLRPPKDLPRDAAELESAVARAYDCWRSGRPVPDRDALTALRDALLDSNGDGRAWGMYALLLRKAAEYAEADECAEFVRQCEEAARRARSLVPDQPDARVAVAGLVPLFGNWGTARAQLAAVLEREPDHVPAAHDMAVLEMATGRPSAARPIVEQLIARDPLAATFYYKRIYHLWTFGEVAEMDRVAARALQLWPRHAAIWLARLWTLVFTGRADEAARFLDEEACRPAIPAAALDLFRRTCMVTAGAQANEAVDPAMQAKAVGMGVAAAGRGPAQAVAALLCLCALDRSTTLSRSHTATISPTVAPSLLSGGMLTIRRSPTSTGA